MGRLVRIEDDRLPENRRAMAIRLHSEYVLDEMVQLYQSLWKQVWNMNIDTVEFNSVLNVLGTDGPPLINFLKGLGRKINEFAPGTIPDDQLGEPVRLTENEDGTLTANTRQTYPGRQ
jgi:hypothetical protein